MHILTTALLAAILLPPALTSAAPAATVSTDSIGSATSEAAGRYSRRYRSMSWTMEGAKLSATQADGLEATLAKEPEDLATRVRLIGWLQASDLFDHRRRLRLNEHIQWLIEHKADEGPEFWSHLHAATMLGGPEANVRALESWNRHLDANPTSTPLIESAADFLRFSEPKYALDLFARAAKLAPRDPRWHDKIAFTHLLRTNTKDRELQYTEASLALRHYENALLLTPENAESYSNLHRYAAEAAWLVDRNDKATRWANLLLKNARAGEWWYNNARHEGYTILGLVAVDENKLDAAGKNLMLSVDVDAKGTGIFTPSLALAAALLDRGRKDVVIEYLEALKDQAQYMPERFETMIASIRTGETPDALKSERRKLFVRKPPRP